MTIDKYMTPAEKFAKANQILKAHPQGEAQDIALAFQQCEQGLESLDRIIDPDLDEKAQSWIEMIRQTMDTTGIDEDPQERGTWLLKAEKLNIDEKSQFSSVVNELADWFNERFWGR